MKERQANIVRGSLFLVHKLILCEGHLTSVKFMHWSPTRLRLLESGTYTHRAILSGQLENTDLTSSGYIEV